MKKIGCILLIILFVSLTLGMASTPVTTNLNPTPMSSQEMSSVVGGTTGCGCGGDGCCCCLDVWIFQICACIFF
jgi:hypothetical protein